ncbi:transcriptional repressor [Gimesia maris]|uniref:transcriptional repressor n=1 Tax=Gimesia maris TaxID=122 RepID=UPI0030DB15AE|tara:strand:+ start:18770 stop:19072 length:303 start_codon:yes stop_codon:yes gene_type:complete
MNFEDELQARFEAHEMSQRLRLTRERLMVARAIARQPDEFTAEDLVEDVQSPQTKQVEQRRCARSTVYRTLSMLVELGMLSQRDDTDFVFRKILGRDQDS